MGRASKIVSAVAVSALVVAVYAPALRGGTVWDDDAHLTRPELRSLDGLWRIWTEVGATQQYYPLTHSVFWIESRLWGEATAGYHVVSVLLHLAVAGLAWAVLRRLRVPGAGLAAALFALHPVHVESVAWISELKNTLSGVFYLGAALAFLGFDPPEAAPGTPRRWRRYGAASLLFACALLSKSVTATLPAALLLVYAWKRGSLDLRRHVVPLLPWLAAGATMGAVTVWVERHWIGAHGPDFDLSYLERGLLAGRALWFYLGKLVWPADLAFVYPRWTIDAREASAYAWPFAVAILLAGLWLGRRALGRGPLVALLFFGGTLFPALGFFDVYPFRFSYVADHFQYLASLGVLSCAAAASALVLRGRGRGGRWLGGAATLGVLLALAVAARAQAVRYVDARTLWASTVERNPGSSLAWNNLGVELARLEDREGALRAYREALALDPDYAQVYFNRGRLLSIMQRPQDAVCSYEKALALDPRHAHAAYNLGLERMRGGEEEAALAAFERALAADPSLVEARYNLGTVLLRLGRPETATEELRRVVEVRPGHAGAWLNLGVARRAVGRNEEAVEAYLHALAARPDWAEARANLGVAWVALGRSEEAAAAFVEAATLLGRRARYAEAAELFRTAIEQAPRNAEAFLGLGMAYARLDRPGAARHAWESAVLADPASEAAEAAREALRAQSAGG